MEINFAKVLIDKMNTKHKNKIKQWIINNNANKYSFNMWFTFYMLFIAVNRDEMHCLIFLNL